ncbi:RnfABCDGE type electron transport complex subunit G [candidate division KSB1 bacterium]|nr:RnfABCDGE type electron transport complex subunit G [candidate division KSB1 bacterium]
MKDILKLGGILMLVTALAAAALALANHLTKDEIDKEERKAERISRSQALPDAAPFAIHPVKKDGKILYYKGYSKPDTTKLVGYAFIALGKGYSSVIKTMVGIDTTGKICGTKIISQKETPGLGTKIEEVKYGDKSEIPWFQKRLKGKMANELVVDKDGGKIESVSGATISSRAVTNSIREAIEKMLPIIRAEKNNQ